MLLILNLMLKLPLKLLPMVGIGFATLIITSFSVKSQWNHIFALDQKICELKKKINYIEPFLEKVKLERDVLVIEKDRTIIQNSTDATLIQVLGGLILSVTAYIGYLNFKVGEDKQVTERFSKAIDHLGSIEVNVRLGGIYSLEQIAIDSPKYHWTVVEILSAFIREKCPIEESFSNPNESQVEPDKESSNIEQPSTYNKIEKVGADVQAALTVIGRRKVAQDPNGKHIDLRKVNLAGVEMQNAKLSGVNFIFSDLSNADFRRADLSNAFLDGTHLCDSNLSHANLSGASLHCYPDTNGNILYTCLSSANLISANLSKANLCGANLNFAMLNGTNFSDAELNQVNLDHAHLGSIKFNNILLKGTDFTGATLSCTILNNVDFQDSNLSRTNFNESSLYDANLSRSINLTQEQLNSARMNANTKLPTYLSSSGQS
jgi:uncharacterized protein YjbI with pentapeptide repeats